MCVYRTGIGQDSHRFLPEDSTKPCVICGVIFEEVPGFSADSDGDVVFHAICNAITSVTEVPTLAKRAKELCDKDGITDSAVYLKYALKSLKSKEIIHVAISLEGKRPYFQDRINYMKEKLSKIMNIEKKCIGITATSGDGLTDFGCGEGVQCFCIITVLDN